MNSQIYLTGGESYSFQAQYRQTTDGDSRFRLLLGGQQPQRLLAAYPGKRLQLRSEPGDAGHPGSGTGRKYQQQYHPQPGHAGRVLGAQRRLRSRWNDHRQQRRQSGRVQQWRDAGWGDAEHELRPDGQLRLCGGDRRADTERHGDAGLPRHDCTSMAARR